MNSFENQMISLGVSAASAFSLPKSVGAIFGLIFASPRPIGLDDLIQKLEISRGSASMGLNFLLKMGAIQVVEVEGIRRTLYEPEMSLRRLLDGLLRTNVLPHLRNSGERLTELQESLQDLAPEDRQILEQRLNTLSTWRKKAQQLAPLAARVLGSEKKRQVARV
jgi:DNA-binding transcriptional regulator GbsR (MarR family)